MRKGPFQALRGAAIPGRMLDIWRERLKRPQAKGGAQRNRQLTQELDGSREGQLAIGRRSRRRQSTIRPSDRCSLRARRPRLPKAPLAAARFVGAASRLANLAAAANAAADSPSRQAAGVATAARPASEDETASVFHSARRQRDRAPSPLASFALAVTEPAQSTCRRSYLAAFAIETSGRNSSLNNIAAETQTDAAHNWPARRSPTLATIEPTPPCQAPGTRPPPPSLRPAV